MLTASDFKKGYRMIPAGRQAAFRESVMRAMGWNTRISFYARMDGKTRIQRAESTILINMFKDEGIDVMDGVYMEHFTEVHNEVV